MPDNPGDVTSEKLAGVIEGGMLRLRPSLRALLEDAPASGSPAEACVAAGVASGDEYPPEQLMRAAAGALGMACDCLDAIPPVLRLRSPVAPAFAVCRTVLEASARLHWLCDGTATPMELLRRAVNDALAESNEVSRLIGGFRITQARAAGTDDSMALRDDHTDARAADLATWGPENGFEPGKGHLGLYVGEQPPSRMERIDRLLRSPDSPEGPGKGHYQVISAVAHADAHASVVFGRPPHSTPAEAFAAPDTAGVAHAVPVALEGFCVAAASAATFFGGIDKQGRQALRVMEYAARELGASAQW